MHRIANGVVKKFLKTTDTTIHISKTKTWIEHTISKLFSKNIRKWVKNASE